MEDAAAEAVTLDLGVAALKRQAPGMMVVGQLYSSLNVVVLSQANGTT